MSEGPDFYVDDFYSFDDFDADERMNPWVSPDQDTDPNAEIWGDPPKRKWYTFKFSIYLTDEQASRINVNYRHIVEAMSGEMQSSEPVSPAWYVDDPYLHEEPKPRKRRWWHRWIRRPKVYLG